MGYAKVIHKKSEKKKLKKMNKCSRYLKQWVLRCCLRKRRIKMNKIAHVFLQKYFKVSTREICFKDAHAHLDLRV